MIIAERDMDRFQELDEQRRRIEEDFNALVQRIRDGSIRDEDIAKTESQHLHVRHENLIREMIDLLSYA